MLPSIDMTKKYRKHKSGTIHYKSGNGWRKRFCEVSGGFLIVHGDASAAGRKASDEATSPASSPLSARDSGGSASPKDSASSSASPASLTASHSASAAGLVTGTSPRRRRSTRTMREAEKETKVKMLVALEGATVGTAQLMPFAFKVGTSKWSRQFYTDTQEDMLEWIGACSYWADQGKYNAFESFAPVREVRRLRHTHTYSVHRLHTFA